MSISANVNVPAKLFLIFYILTFLAGCNFLSVKQYQCLDREWQDYRDNHSFPVYNGLTIKEFENKFGSNNRDGDLFLHKSGINTFYLKYHSCPIRRYLFENGRLVEEGRLYFDGFWHYVSVSIPERDN